MNPRELPGAHNPEPGMCERPRVMLTLHCTRECPYCTIKPHVPPTLFRELSAVEWAERFARFNELGYGRPIFGGREPTLHREFARILQLAPKESKPITVYSNFDTKLDIRSFSPRDSEWMVTLHRKNTPEDVYAWARRVTEFKRAGFNVKADTLGLTPENLEQLLALDMGVPLYCKPWVDLPHPPQKPQACLYSVRWFAPDGSRWFCSDKMLRNDARFRVDDDHDRAIVCDEPTCNACDWWFIRSLNDVQDPGGVRCR